MQFFTPASFFVAFPTQPKFSFGLPIPNVPALDGIAINLQAWWFDPNAVPQFQASNGVHCTLGRAGPP